MEPLEIMVIRHGTTQDIGELMFVYKNINLQRQMTVKRINDETKKKTGLILVARKMQVVQHPDSDRDRKCSPHRRI
jgi:hypothetical protein